MFRLPKFGRSITIKRIMPRFSALVLGLILLCVTDSRAQPVVGSGTFILHLAAKPAGKETYTLTSTSSGLHLQSHFEYSDRGAPVPLDFGFDCDSELRPIALHINGKSSRFSALKESVTVRSRTVTVERNEKTNNYPAPARFFTGDENTHGALQELLVRYWSRHGKPASIHVFPAGVVKIELLGHASVNSSGKQVPLDVYAVSGLIWGQEILWMDPSQRVAAIIEPGQFEIVREEYESALSWFIQQGVTNSLKSLTMLAGGISYPVRRKIAIIGGVLIDGAGGRPIADTAILTQDGRITNIGRRSEVVIPRDALVIHAQGKTVLPGLWDMHAHYSQAELGPVYLANGVTTVRDVGNEIDFIPTIRNALNAGKGIGPHIEFAGVIDGTGPRPWVR